MPRSFATLMLLVPLLVTAVGAFVVLIIARTFTSGSRDRLPTDPGRPVSLHAWVARPGQTGSMSTRFDRTVSGRLSLSGGSLLWDPDEGPRWAAPIPSITVLGVSGAGTFTADPYIDIAIDGSGPWRMVVSDRPINRIMGNDAKRFREARRARELADLLVRSGARSPA
jgi:hypothetical protein